MCEPEVIYIEEEFEGFDNDGYMETSTHNVYNCQECDEEECKYWKEYN